MSTRASIRHSEDFCWHVFTDFHAEPEDTVFLEVYGDTLRSIETFSDRDGKMYLVVGLSPERAREIGLIQKEE
jgi:hypothetical protein